MDIILLITFFGLFSKGLIIALLINVIFLYYVVSLHKRISSSFASDTSERPVHDGTEGNFNVVQCPVMVLVVNFERMMNDRENEFVTIAPFGAVVETRTAGVGLIS
ncbi:hypothetical protein BDN72DRAFT_851638 [Pluteus cervinus]|uniref:Uncharacterized protein n=1 Tax=Pluteus cervinus TaxID=181527 RepID=A0ACD2ZZ19_9AGAR|nr:hypothetical protein BDN72DRAFT_851638 [Pluteus cervinus]